MKRIAYLSLSEGWGGLEMNQLRNALAMHGRGHEVLLIANGGSAIAKRAAQENIPLYIVQQKTKHYQWFFAWKLSRYLFKQGFNDLFFRNNREQSIAASIAFLSLGKIKVHYFMEMALGGKRNQFFRTLRYRFFTSWCCPLPYLKDQVLELTKVSVKKVHVIPSGIESLSAAPYAKNDARELLGWPQNHTLLVMVGRIDPKKRQEFVFEMFLKRQNPDEMLLFVGESTIDEPSDYYISLQQKTSSSAKKAQILFAGFQHNMQAVYAAADLVIMAAEYETVGMATLEALQHGCPVVGVNNGGSKALIEQYGGGLCYEAKDEKSLSTCIDLIKAKHFPAFIKTDFEQHFNFDNVCTLVEQTILN